MTYNLQLVVRDLTSPNTCSIFNGARVWATSMFLGGETNTAVNNVLSITGSNLFLSVGFNFYIGAQGASNRLVIITLPLAKWLALLTNQFDANGNFTFTNAITPASVGPRLILEGLRQVRCCGQLRELNVAACARRWLI
jgi:hypothetical protein